MTSKRNVHLDKSISTKFVFKIARLKSELGDFFITNNHEYIFLHVYITYFLPLQFLIIYIYTIALYPSISFYTLYSYFISL